MAGGDSIPKEGKSKRVSRQSNFGWLNAKNIFKILILWYTRAQKGYKDSIHRPKWLEWKKKIRFYLNYRQTVKIVFEKGEKGVVTNWLLILKRQRYKV